MKHIYILFCIALMGMGWAPKPPEPEPDPPPVIEKPEKLLTEYLWEDSDELVPGKAILMPHASFTGQVERASVFDEALTFHSVYSGREVWYAKNNIAYYGKANLTVETHDTIYRTIIKNEPVEPPAVGTTVELLNYHKRTNGSRQTWYGSMDMNQYPSPMRLQIDGCTDITFEHNGNRYCSENCYSGSLVKQSDVSGRGIAVLQESSCNSKIARLIY